MTDIVPGNNEKNTNASRGGISARVIFNNQRLFLSNFPQGNEFNAIIGPSNVLGWGIVKN